MKPPSLSLSLRGSMSPLMIAKKSGQFSTLQVAAAKRGIKTIESKQIHTTREGLGGILSTEEKVHRLLKGANFREAARWAIPLKTSHESVSSELTLTFHRTEYRVKYKCKMLWNAKVQSGPTDSIRKCSRCITPKSSILLDHLQGFPWNGNRVSLVYRFRDTNFVLC